MKKLVFLLLVTLSLISSTNTVFVSAVTQTLRVYNWAEYIDEGKDEEGNQRVEDGVLATSIIDDFEAYYAAQNPGKTVDVIYTTYETNEVMYNSLKTGNQQYDLVCPSDYMIERMIAQNMLEEFEVDDSNEYVALPNYNRYASPYLKELFARNDWTRFAAGYMWGTMGYLYDPSDISDDLVKSWDLLWNEEYKNKVTVKDSVRDTYLIGVAHVYKDELIQAADDYETGVYDKVEYQAKVTEILNRTDDETIAKVEEALNALKNNVYAFEVDSGKSDIVAGKISASFAWSGDAVYAIQLALEEDDKVLNYAIPEEGSNVWFDAWVMPKGANKELAQAFVDYLSKPEVAVKNMSYIGYTSAIAGDEVFELAEEWYGDEEGDITVDLSYFFEGTFKSGKNAVITTSSELLGQLLAQYPEEEVIARCGVMKDFGDQHDAVIAMWQRVKSNTVSVWIYVILGVVVLGAIAGYFYFSQTKKMRLRRLKAKTTR